MKKLLLLLATAASLSATQVATAQVGFSVNIGSQPAWGPSGYEYARYYYLPDIDAYYDVNSQLYVYNSNGSWIQARTLPSSFGFDPYNSYKVVINDPTPWRYHNKYRSRYYSFRGHRGQPMLYSADPKYMQQRSRTWGGYRDRNYQYDRFRKNRWDDDNHRWNNDRRRDWDKHKDRD